MRLSLFSFLPKDLVSALEQAGIRTDSDLMFSASTIDILQKLAPGTVTLAELNAYKDQIVSKSSALGVRGHALLDLERERVASRLDLDLTSGVNELDALLDGFGGSRVFEVSGEKASGKTALAMHVVLRHLVSHESSAALWIDTTGDFSAEKVEQLVQLHPGQVASTALQRLQVSLVFDIEAAHDVLDALSSVLSSPPSSNPCIRILVIDSITPLLSPALSFVSSQGHAIMTTFMRQLRTLARAHGLCIFVVNNATSSAPAPYNPSSAFASTAAKPALGPSFAFLTDATVWMAQYREKNQHQEEMVDESTLHVVEVFRSKTTVENVVLFKNPRWDFV